MPEQPQPNPDRAVPPAPRPSDWADPSPQSGTPEAEPSYQERLRDYAQQVERAARADVLASADVQQSLLNSQEELGLETEDARDVRAQVQRSLEAEHLTEDQRYQEYRAAFTAAFSDWLSFNSTTQTQLADLRQQLQLTDAEATQIEQGVINQQLDSLPPDRPSFIAAGPGNALPPEAITQAPIEPVSSTFFDEQATAIAPPGSMEPLPVTALQPVVAEVTDAEISMYCRLLESVLREGDWKRADGETLDLLLKATNSTADWLSPEAIATIPFPVLDAIDRLWHHYSGGLFGFRAQWQVYWEAAAATLTGKPASNGSSAADRSAVATAPPDFSALHRLSFLERQRTALEFSKRVDWWTRGGEFLKYYNWLTFGLQRSPTESTPMGHLPAAWFWRIPWWKALRSGGLGASRGGCHVDGETLFAIMAILNRSRPQSLPNGELLPAGDLPPGDLPPGDLPPNREARVDRQIDSEL